MRISRERVFRGHGQDQIGLAQLPIARPLGKCRQIGGHTFLHSLLQPAFKQSDFRVFQTAIPDKFARFRFWSQGGM